MCRYILKYVFIVFADKYTICYYTDILVTFQGV